MVDIKKHGRKLVLIHLLDKDETYKINERKGIFSLAIFKKPQWVKGITSYCEDGQHILCLDYDSICYWIVKKELEDLSDIHGPFIVFKTREKIINGEKVGHYHSYCLKKFLPNEIVRIQRQTHCDSAYTTMPLRSIYRSHVLRLSDKEGSNKPTFVEIIGKDKMLDYEISEAHYNILCKLYKQIQDIDYKVKDGLKKIYFNVYETGR